MDEWARARATSQKEATTTRGNGGVRYGCRAAGSVSQPDEMEIGVGAQRLRDPRGPGTALSADRVQGMGSPTLPISECEEDLPGDLSTVPRWALAAPDLLRWWLCPCQSLTGTVY